MPRSASYPRRGSVYYIQFDPAIGTLTPQTMARVEDAIRDHCDLPEGRVLP